MSDAPQSRDTVQMTKQEQDAVLFAQLVFQLSNTAMVLMGKMADPETGKSIRDLEAARLFIDQLEMLEAKTKGNLEKEESALLKQSLMSLRMAYVEAVEAKPAAPESHSAAPDSQPSGAAAPSAEPAPGIAAADADDHRKKFSKKY